MPRLVFRSLPFAATLAVFAAILAVAPRPARAQAAAGVAFSTLHSFGTPISDGAHPYGGLIVGPGGTLYGTTSSGGYDGDGTVYSISASGAEALVYDFTDGESDGDVPYGQLVLGTNGSFYVTTNNGGGSVNEGEDYSLTTSGAITLLDSFYTGFAYFQGINPRSGFVLGSDGDLYGTCTYGSDTGSGAVYKITPSGSLTQIHGFGGQPYDGSYPFGPLVLGTDGDFYGTTGRGGTDDLGTVFKITPSGTLTTLYSFTGTADGSYPLAGVAEGSNGSYYGLAYAGGANDTGTVFRVTPTGGFTLLHSFSADPGNDNAGNHNGDRMDYGSGSGNADGAFPIEALTVGQDGNLYGATECGGKNDTGTVFRITPSGTLATLYAFSADTTSSGNADGCVPHGSLLEVGSGTFYGTTAYGGTGNVGSVYKLVVASSISKLSALALNPTSVNGGSASTGTVTITASAPFGGETVTLSSSSKSATVPSSATIAAGAKSVTFKISTVSVTSSTKATISATADGVSKTAVLTITPAVAPGSPTLKDIILAPASVQGGTTTKANQIYLTGNATATTPVTLTSSNTAVASVPSSVTVMAGSSSQAFTITTQSVTMTQTVTITASSGGVSQSAVLTVTPAPPITESRFDFNKDGHADLVWYNSVSGGVSVWDMNDTSVLNYGPTFTSLYPASGWMPVATPDVNGDGYPDLMWWNSQTGAMSIWTLQNTNVTAFYNTFATVADTTWKPVAAADVTGATWELVFQNSVSGDIAAWQMNGQTVVSEGATIGSLGAGSPWQVVGAPDLDGDGRSDLLFWNSRTGEVSYWSCNLAVPQVLAFHGNFTQLADPSWHLVGSEDTNGDGQADLLWWNANTGEVSRWLLNGTTVNQFGGETTQVSDTTWQPTAIR